MTNRDKCIPTLGNNHFDWYYTKTNERAIAVVIHGLNTKPEKMGCLVNFLLEKDISVINVKLSGHRDNIDEFKKVTREIWLAEINSAFNSAKKYQKRKKLPLIFLGFSLGGLIGLELATISDSRLYDCAIMFAPAVTPRCRTHLVKLLFIYGNEFIIPSKAPFAYRANKGTTVAAYKALFKHSKNLLNAKKIEKINIPALCFIDPEDELINLHALKKFVMKNHLDKWQIIEIKKDKDTAKEKYSHLIIEPDTTGLKTWKKIEKNIDFFLNLINSRSP